MNEPKQKIDYHEHDTPKQESFPDISNVASVNECTGLMYRTPVDGTEWEALQQLSPMGIPRVREEMDGTVSHRLHTADRGTAEDAEKAVQAADEEESGYIPRHMKQE